ncbi:MAG: hypothetical protein U5K74_11055 [Gemmatimonadaceae bacterium]|nr:hypothetical protein [Gemmatimonadaceae bacterium]
MWADQVLAFERAHLYRLLLWGVASIITALGCWVYLRLKRLDVPLLKHFAIQTGAWGAIDAVLALAARPGLALRDYDGVTSLDRFLWFNCGLDVGYVAVGVTLGLCGWRLSRSRGLVGAGLGVGIQGAALLLLDLRLAALLSQAR